jgi:excisionase family DNA binding protein
MSQADKMEELDDKEFMTLDELQSTLRIGRNKTRKLARSEGFPAIKIGTTVRIPKEEFKKWYRTLSYRKTKNAIN